VIGLFLIFWQHWLFLELVIDLCNFAHHIFKMYYNSTDVLNSIVFALFPFLFHHVRDATCLNLGFGVIGQLMGHEGIKDLLPSLLSSNMAENIFTKKMDDKDTQCHKK